MFAFILEAIGSATCAYFIIKIINYYYYEKFYRIWKKFTGRSNDSTSSFNSSFSSDSEDAVSTVNEWVAAQGGEIPEGAVVGGHNHLGKIYVARAMHEGLLTPGKFIPKYGYCYISINGEEIKKQNYEVLCNVSAEWVACSSDEYIPENAIPGGLDQHGEVVYIGRIKYDGSVYVGKVVGGICYTLKKNKEYENRKYEILTDKTNSVVLMINKLQELQTNNLLGGVLNVPKIPTEPMNVPKSKLKEGVHFEDVANTETDYINVERNMRKGSSVNYSIVKIERILNSKAWINYKHYSENVIMKENAGDKNEKYLFHGSSNCRDIAKNGFDERRSSQSGFFGAGVYFAEIADKSDSYVGLGSGGQYQMLVCKVALGKVHKITSGAQKYFHAPVGYHSVKGQPLNHVEYIVYRGEQAFPRFLITYTK